MAEINIGCRLMWGDVFLALRLVDLEAGAVGLGIGSDWLGGGVSAASARFQNPGGLRSTYGVQREHFCTNIREGGTFDAAIKYAQSTEYRAKKKRTFPQLGTKINVVQW